MDRAILGLQEALSCGRENDAWHALEHIVAHWKLTGKIPSSETSEPAMDNLVQLAVIK